MRTIALHRAVALAAIVLALMTAAHALATRSTIVVQLAGWGVAGAALVLLCVPPGPRASRAAGILSVLVALHMAVAGPGAGVAAVLATVGLALLTDLPGSTASLTLRATMPAVILLAVVAAPLPAADPSLTLLRALCEIALVADIAFQAVRAVVGERSAQVRDAMALRGALEKDEPRAYGITAAERRVLYVLCVHRNYTSQDIARACGLAKATVNRYITSMIARTSSDNRAALANLFLLHYLCGHGEEDAPASLPERVAIGCVDH